jgi:hypothetical protein
MLWLLVPLTVLWGNLHGMVLLAFLVTGAFASGEALENLARWWNTRETDRRPFWSSIIKKPVLALAALTAALVVAALAQPSGYHLFFLGGNFTDDPLLKNIILEMLPTPAPVFRLHGDLPWQFDNIALRPPGFWTFWVALAIIIILLIGNRMRLPYGADYLLLGFFAWQAIAHWRLLPLFAIAAAGPAASLVYSRIRQLDHRRRYLEAPVATLALGALVVWFNFTVNEDGTFFERNREMFRGEVANQFDYPAPLMDYIVEARLPDNMLSDSNYCGYAIWRLSPEHHKLFTDNRFDLFGSKFIHLERNMLFAFNRGDRYGDEVFTDDWDDLLDRFKINFIVIRPVDRPYLHAALMESGKWRIVYYFIPKGSPRSQWPYAGNYVYVRKDGRADAIAKRSSAIFQRQFPNEILPERLESLLRAMK